jgi:hypothetical protein
MRAVDCSPPPSVFSASNRTHQSCVYCTAASITGAGSVTSSQAWPGKATTLSYAGTTGKVGARSSSPKASSTRSHRTPVPAGRRARSRRCNRRPVMRSTSLSLAKLHRETGPRGMSRLRDLRDAIDAGLRFGAAKATVGDQDWRAAVFGTPRRYGGTRGCQSQSSRRPVRRRRYTRSRTSCPSAALRVSSSEPD